MAGEAALIAVGEKGSDGDLLRRVGLVGVGGAGEHAQLAQHLRGDEVLREHPLDGVLDDELRMARAHQGHLAVAFPADEAGEEHVLVRLLLAAGEDDLLGVDHHHEVSNISVW